MNNNEYNYPVFDPLRMLDLLTEYTSRLQQICDAKSRTDIRRFQIIWVIGLVGVFTFVFAIASFLDQQMTFNSLTFNFTLAAGAVALFTCLMLIRYNYSSRFHYLFDASRVASALLRLVKLSSQYGEHSHKRISDLFEYELRIAEAEASLELYFRVFKREPVDNRNDGFGKHPSTFG